MMRVESYRVKIEGHLLHRFTLHPDEGVPVRACGIFYHGQGDYAERYAEVLHPFTECGIRCVITDLPGHGYSPGRRGHGGDAALLDAVIDNTLEGFGSLPYVVMGHSMGGLLVARHLVLAGQGRFDVPSLAWVNAPLVRPGYGKSRVLIALVKTLGHWLPELTISTGVTSEMCRPTEDSPEIVKERAAVRHKLWHSRISMGWAAVLMEAGELLTTSLSEMPKETSVLVTQGGADQICPAEITKEFFEGLPQNDKVYHEFPDKLHELFSGDGNDALSEVLASWLEKTFT
jgi:alpha-beta hydrolase superfamily lysophospholipase